METYKQFWDRINSFQTKQLRLGDKDFTVSRSVAQKVNGDNTYKDFYGDTVVFALDDQAKAELTKYADILHCAAPQCFCQRLIPHTFHVTLHDLSNSAVLRDVAEDVFCNELKILQIKKELRPVKIKLKSTYIFNMVNTSLVLGLFPATQKDYSAIMRLYSAVDGVKKLNYPFTPHITLAYYNANGFNADAAKSLEHAVNQINSQINTEFTVSELYYQKFTSMNNYIDIVRLLR